MNVIASRICTVTKMLAVLVATCWEGGYSASSPTRPIDVTRRLTVRIVILEPLSLFQFSLYVQLTKTFDAFEGVILESNATVSHFFACLQPSSFDNVGTVNDLLLKLTVQVMSYGQISVA